MGVQLVQKMSPFLFTLHIPFINLIILVGFYTFGRPFQQLPGGDLSPKIANKIIYLVHNLVQNLRSDEMETINP